MSNYVPGGDYEALKEAAGPQVTLDFQGPIGSNNEDEGYDTYFNSNELPPTPSDFGPTASTGPNNADNFLQNQSLPPRSSGGLFDTSGPPRHSGVKDPFNDPFGDDDRSPKIRQNKQGTQKSTKKGTQTSQKGYPRGIRAGIN